ncbi:hypothetical protein F3J24_20095 [Comamonas sp. Tr-654]|uniref:hypothetical protein n=1 Tax=Comamonas sp. Tr-654 TaxID=2608341 RepID=UPI00141F7A27|nr:hypothetical protein [Comamonas sp. Tr-654]
MTGVGRTQSVTTSRLVSRDRHKRSIQPEFAAIDLLLAYPDTFNLWHPHIVAMSAGTALMWLAQQLHMSSICRRSDLQDLAEQLDLEGIAMLVDEDLQDLSRQSFDDNNNGIYVGQPRTFCLQASTAFLAPLTLLSFKTGMKYLCFMSS